MPESEEALRLDVWLYRTRLCKTRSLAGRMIEGGKVRLTRSGQTDRIRKTHRLVRAGDGLSFRRGQTVLSVTIMGIPTRRGPAAEAQSYYELNEATRAP